jgi:hypothetical protein
MSIAQPAGSRTSGLITPHGGSLVDLMVPPEQREAVRAGVDRAVECSDRNACDVELLVVPAGWMRDYRAEQRGLSKFSERTAAARWNGASDTGRPVVHRQDNEHVRPLWPRFCFLCSPP